MKLSRLQNCHASRQGTKLYSIRDHSPSCSVSWASGCVVTPAHAPIVVSSTASIPPIGCTRGHRHWNWGSYSHVPNRIDAKNGPTEPIRTSGAHPTSSSIALIIGGRDSARVVLSLRSSSRDTLAIISRGSPVLSGGNRNAEKRASDCKQRGLDQKVHFKGGK